MSNNDSTSKNPFITEVKGWVNALDEKYPDFCENKGVIVIAYDITDDSVCHSTISMMGTRSDLRQVLEALISDPADREAKELIIGGVLNGLLRRGAF